MEAALTAAAEAGPKLDGLIAGITEENRHPESFAAEAGEPPKWDDELWKKSMWPIGKDAATIERCVQKIELFIVQNRINGEVQALINAIRALKDQAPHSFEDNPLDWRRP